MTMNRPITLAFVSVVLAACGDNSAPLTDAHGHVGDGGGDAGGSGSTATVAAGDFTPGDPGTMATLDTASFALATNVAPAGSVGDDPVLRRFAGELFIVNRSDGDNVTVLDAATHALVEQDSTGTGSNPQDVAVHGNKLYVPIYNGKGVAVITRGSSDKPAIIDLSADDPDGDPNCNSAFTVGDDVYVACELLDATFTPRGNGKIYVIDTASDTVSKTIAMMNPNPFGVFEQLPTGELVIPTTDFASGGCIEKISTGPSAASGGCIVTNVALGGFVNRFDFQTVGSASIMWIVVNISFGVGNVQKYDLTAGMLAATPITRGVEDPVDLAACPDGSLVISDGASGDAGLRVYANDHEISGEAPIAIGLPTGSANALLCD